MAISQVDYGPETRDYDPEREALKAEILKDLQAEFPNATKAVLGLNFKIETLADNIRYGSPPIDFSITENGKTVLYEVDTANIRKGMKAKGFDGFEASDAPDHHRSDLTTCGIEYIPTSPPTREARYFTRPMRVGIMAKLCDLEKEAQFKDVVSVKIDPEFGRESETLGKKILAGDIEEVPLRFTNKDGSTFVYNMSAKDIREVMLKDMKEKNIKYDPRQHHADFNSIDVPQTKNFADKKVQQL